MRRVLLTLGLIVLSLCLLPLITGCGVSITAPNIVESQIQNGAPIHGNLQGGHQPIVNARIHLLAAAITGYGGASTSLLTFGTSGTDSIGGYVTAAADGSFSIDGAYHCSPGQELYLLATGGNSQGDPNGPSNPSIFLMSALGVCPGSGSLNSMSATLNEVSTVAMAFALAPFATDATHIGTTGTPASYVGIENAVATIGNLIDRTSGTALATTPAGNGIAPQATLNTLANILAACIDTNGTTPPTCSTLFSLATSDGTAYGTRPADTATAAINIAHHPASNVAALYALSTSASPFAGALSTQPSDLTLTLAFATHTPAGPNTLAIDAAGNVWFPYSNGLGGFTPVGVPMPESPFVDPSLQTPQSIAIDQNGDIWLANYTGSSYTRFNPSSGFTSAAVPGLDSPSSVAIDPAGNAWFSNYLGNSLTRVSTNGAGTGTFPTIASPLQVLSDTAGNLWSPNYSNGTVYGLTGNGTPLNTGGFAAPSLNPAVGSQIAALDSTHTLWILNQDASISALSTTGVPLPGTPFHIGSSSYPVTLALDGSNSLWTLTQVHNLSDPYAPDTNVLSGFNRSGASFLTNHTFPYNNMTNLAVDGSGNLWVASNGITTIYEIVGLTAPVVTPTSVGVAHNTLATRP